IRDLIVTGFRRVLFRSRARCTANGDYDLIDLTQLSKDYLPRTNYVPDCPPAIYRDRSPSVPWEEEKKVTDYYRLVFRRQLSQSRSEERRVGKECRSRRA